MRTVIVREVRTPLGDQLWEWAMVATPGFGLETPRYTQQNGRTWVHVDSETLLIHGPILFTVPVRDSDVHVVTLPQPARLELRVDTNPGELGVSGNTVA